MVSLEDSQSSSGRFPMARTFCSPYVSSSSAKIQRTRGRSMRTVRSNLSQGGGSCSFSVSNAGDSEVDVAKTCESSSASFSEEEKLLECSNGFSDLSSACSSDISGELQRLANIPSSEKVTDTNPNSETETFATEIIESMSLEDLKPTVKIWIENLQSSSTAVKRSTVAKLRLLAKYRADNRAVIGESGAVPALIPLLRCDDPLTQEHAVTALLNLSLDERNKTLITNGGAIKSLIYILKTGTETSKQNAACALLNLSLIDENKSSIGAGGAIPPLVSLLKTGSSRGKKDALTALYTLCSLNKNKERAVAAGTVKPLVELVAEVGNGIAEKAMAVLTSLGAISEGKESIVEEGGIGVLVEAIEEDGCWKRKEFAVAALLQLCSDSVRNRGLLVREGGIPPLVALSQTGTARAKKKAEVLLKYLRKPRDEEEEAPPSSSSSSTP